MEGYPTDIQALLQDIRGNYGDLEPEQPSHPLLYSRPVSTSYTSQVEHSIVPRDALAPNYEQQRLYEAQASRPSDANFCRGYNDTRFDTSGSYLKLENARGRADCCLDRVLEEPQPHPQCQAESSMKSLTAGRLSLPGHTAPHSPVNAFQESKARNKGRGRYYGVLPIFHC